MVSLYNELNKINDLIRAAHPHGGTDVVVVESPNGGEGRVEDSIEHQIRTLRMVYTEPTAKVLADLALDLEKQGARYANQIDIILEDFVKNAVGPMDRPGSFVPTPAPQTEQERVDEAMRDRQQRVEEGQQAGKVQAPEASRKASVVRKAMSVLSRAMSRLNTLGDVIIKDPGIEQGDKDKAIKKIKEIKREFELAKSKVNRGKYTSNDDIAKLLSSGGTFTDSLTKNIQDVVDDLKGIELTDTGYTRKLFHLFGDIKEGESTFGGIAENQINAIENDLRAASSVGNFVAANSIDKAEQVVGNIPDPGEAMGKPVKPKPKKGPAGRVEAPGAAKDVSERPEKKVPPGAAKKPKDPKEQAAQAAVGKGPSVGEVKRIQKLVGVEEDGKYGSNTHNALDEWLLTNFENKDSQYHEHAKYIRGKGWFTGGPSQTFPNLKAMYTVITQGPPTPAKAVKVDPLTELTITSPVTMREVSLPFGRLLRLRTDPLAFIQKLKDLQVLPDRMSNQQIIDAGYLREIGTAMAESMKARNASEEDIRTIPALMDMVSDGARKEIAAGGEKSTIYEFIRDKFPNEAARLMTNVPAMREFRTEMQKARMGDSKGFMAYPENRMTSTRSGFVGSLLTDVLRGKPTGRTTYDDPVRSGWPGEEREGTMTLDQLSTTRRATVTDIAEQLAQMAAKEKDPSRLMRYVDEAVRRMKDKVPALARTEAVRLFNETFKKIRGGEQPQAPVAQEGAAKSVKDLSPEARRDAQTIFLDIADMLSDPAVPAGSRPMVIQKGWEKFKATGYPLTKEQFEKRVTQTAQSRYKNRLAQEAKTSLPNEVAQAMKSQNPTQAYRALVAKYKGVVSAAEIDQIWQQQKAKKPGQQVTDQAVAKDITPGGESIKRRELPGTPKTAPIPYTGGGGRVDIGNRPGPRAIPSPR